MRKSHAVKPVCNTPVYSGAPVYNKIHSTVKVAMVHLSYKRGEEGWYNGESAHFPPMLSSGFKYQRQCYVWVEFVFSSLLCFERFSSGTLVSPSAAQKSTFPNSNLIWNA